MNVEELLRDALAAEAEHYDASPELWSRIADASSRRPVRRFVLPLLAAAACATVLTAVVVTQDKGADEVRTGPPAAPPITITTVPAVQEPGSGRCPDIHFTPNSSDMASNIESGTGAGYPPDPIRNCQVAEVLIRDVATAHNFVTGPREFRQDPAWMCTVVTEEVELPVGHYICYQSSYRVSWDKT